MSEFIAAFPGAAPCDLCGRPEVVVLAVWLEGKVVSVCRLCAMRHMDAARKKAMENCEAKP